MSATPLRGEIWNADLGRPQDPEQGLRRPVLVVGEGALALDGLVVIVPFTRTRWDSPAHVEVEPSPGTGLDETSYAQADQVRALSTTRLLGRRGVVDGLTMLAVARVLRLVLRLPASGETSADPR